MIKEIKTLLNLCIFQIQKFTWRIRLDLSISKAYAKLNIAQEMSNRDRITSNTGEREEGEEAAAPAALVGGTGGAFLGKDCSPLVPIALKSLLAGGSSSKRGLLSSTGQRSPAVHVVAACFARSDPGEYRTPGSKRKAEKPQAVLQASAPSCRVNTLHD